MKIYTIESWITTNDEYHQVTCLGFDVYREKKAIVEYIKTIAYYENLKPTPLLKENFDGLKTSLELIEKLADPQEDTIIDYKIQSNLYTPDSHIKLKIHEYQPQVYKFGDEFKTNYSEDDD